MGTVSKLLGLGLCLVVSLTIACSNQPGSPVSPSGVAGSMAFDESEANPDGSLLKTNAPTLMSPIDNVRVDTLTPTLTTGHVAGKYATASFSYEFELYDGSTRIATTTLPAGAGSTTSWTLPSTVTLGTDKPYTWRTRPVTAGVSGLVTGPWSSVGTFLSLDDEPASFNNATGLYDTLYDGKTIGNRVGPTTFIPGVGLRLDDFSSYVVYRLPESLTAGEFSIIVTNIGWNTEGAKTKIMAMGDGAADITTSDYRATYEKRGDPPGVIAWRFRYGGGRQIDTEGAERVQLSESALNDRGTYLWRVTWGGPHCLEIFRFSDGQVQSAIYSSCKNYSGTYRPTPHFVYLGSPAGRAGVTDATVPGIIIRRVWASASPRPLYANRN